MTESSSFVQPAIPKFDGHYDHWSMLMENFLRSKEYWSLVENGVPAAAEGETLTDVQKKSIDDQKLKDLKAKNFLFQALDRSVLETILKKDTAKDIWDSMKQKYQGTTRVKRAQLQALRKEFEVLQMKNGETVNEYIARALSIANKMKANGEDKGDVAVVEKILRSMTPKFNYVVCSIEESNDTSKLTIDELQSSLLVHEQRMSTQIDEEHALKISHGDQYGGRGRSSGRGGRGRGRGRQNFDKSTVECFRCHKLGHFQWECLQKEVNFAEGQEELLLMAYTTTGIANNEDTWFLDSGCSNHMCGKKEYFFDFDANFRDSVKLGNNSSLLVKGKGNIREESKAYRLYDPTSNKIIASRDVVFEEDKSWEWNKKNEEIVVRDLEWGVDEEELNDNTEADPIFSTAEGSESDPNDADLLSDSDQVDSGYVAAINYFGGVPIWTAGGPSVSVDVDGAFHFRSNGTLQLVNGSGAVVWDSNTSHLGVTSASLDDSGNLVLRNRSGFSVWSSFQNPTDTIVPGQNFTVKQVLKSGIYSFQLRNYGNLTLRWNDSIDYWNQGLNSSVGSNLSSPVLGLQPIGILSISDLTLTSAYIVVYSNDYAEGTDILRFLKLDSDGNLRIYSSALGSGTTTMRWAALADQCQVFGYCGNLGICSYNDSGSNPICGCPSENFEPVDVNDSRKGCKRKVEIENCPGSATMLEMDHAKFLTYQPEISSQVFFVGISACRLNCLVGSSCAASTSLSDGTGLCYLKTSDFVRGYQNPSLPSTSYVKVFEETNRKKFSVWAYEEFEKGNVNAIVDKKLDDQDVDMEQATRAIQVSFWCIQEQPSQRPMMGKVVQMLEGITEIKKPPAPKAITEGSAFGTSINMSSNGSTFSTFAASASAPAPSSFSSYQTIGVSPLPLGRNMEGASSSPLGSDLN
ncbi:hypothetical protein GH714_024080 [Hevea brasiliensis]|uniref:Bulb-type lectin domain-containing protein n=1 Tax=Hevea brasiliensis TaxID=3981 RepID=A0A6A6LBK9_HEVBR|nr:hypothetical protein GH714_024080 [Hevea brasiliensis]